MSLAAATRAAAAHTAYAATTVLASGPKFESLTRSDLSHGCITDYIKYDDKTQAWVRLQDEIAAGQLKLVEGGDAAAVDERVLESRARKRARASSCDMDE